MLTALLLVLAVATLALVELAKATRWWALLPSPRPTYRVTLRALVAGQLANALAPIRAGELLGLGLLRLSGGPLFPATAALGATKAVDAAVLAAIALAVVGSAAGQRGLAVEAAALGSVALALIVLTAPRVLPLLRGVPILRRLQLDRAAETLAELRRPAPAAALAATTLLAWAAGLAANALVLGAAGLDPSLDLAARVILAGYLVGVLPAPPMRLGVFEAGVTASLVSGGVPFPTALAASVTLHVCQLVELGLLIALTSARLPRLASPS